jgi:hypothetical protein
MAGYNEIYDSKVVKFTINIPLDDYEQITKQCKERRIHRAVWVREAITRNFDLSHTTKELIQYEIMRHAGDIKLQLPVKEPLTCTTSSSRTEADNVFHKFPGFVGGLLRNPFVLNKIRHQNKMA